MGIFAQELRIGNFVWDDIFYYSIKEISDIVQGEIIEVHNMSKARTEDFYTDGMYSLNWENINGIPLTEEWLLKFGFEKINHRIEGVIYRREWLNFSETFLADWRGGYIGRIQYVHQLQNLYFALTGEELTIK